MLIVRITALVRRAFVAVLFGSAHRMVECSGKSIAGFAAMLVAPANTLSARAF